MSNVKKVIDAPPLPFLPTGYPVIAFRLSVLPSLNDVLYINRKEVTTLIRQERLAGRTAAAEWLQKQRIPVTVKQEPGKGGVTYLRAKEVVFTGRLFCFAEIKRERSLKDKRKGNRRRDVYNLLIKGFIDGCTDAGLWVDDSEEYHTDVWTHYGGTAERSSVEVRLYEL